MYQFKRTQLIDKPLELVWDFISNPRNLKKITPPYMGFDITTSYIPDKMYEGLIIAYKVSPLLGLKMEWVTEITHVKQEAYFVDEQRIGPYKMWHHEHILEKTDKGILMTDIVSYEPPFGLLGKLVNRPIIKPKLNQIFDFRTEAMNEIFN